VGSSQKPPLFTEERQTKITAFNGREATGSKPVTFNKKKNARKKM
jgi:hypothetical protein